MEDSGSRTVPRVAAGWWAPLALVAVVHLAAQVTGADRVAAGSQMLLVPALAAVPTGAARSAPGRHPSPALPWALAALVASWSGDTLPKVVPEGASFIVMIGAFAVAQVLWTVAFTRAPGHRPHPAFVVVLVVAATALLVAVVPHAGVLAPAVVVYASLLSATAYLAARHGALGAVGGALFVVSDGLIALGAFRPGFDLPGRGFLVMATYIAAQALLVVAALRMSGAGTDADR